MSTRNLLQGVCPPQPGSGRGHPWTVSLGSPETGEGPWPADPEGVARLGLPRGRTVFAGSGLRAAVSVCLQ